MNQTDIAIEPKGNDGRDRRRIGILLVAASSVVTLALIVVFAFQMIRSSDDMMAKEANGVSNFSTAAGSNH